MTLAQGKIKCKNGISVALDPCSQKRPPEPLRALKTNKFIYSVESQKRVNRELVEVAKLSRDSVESQLRVGRVTLLESVNL